MARRRTRRDVLAVTGALGIAGLAGCIGGGGGDGGSGDGGNGSDGGGGDSNLLSWHAGGQSGTYYPLSNQFKQVVEDNTDYSLQVQTTGASVENAGNLGSGDADFALIQNDIAYFAVNGTGIDAFQDNAISNIRGVATLYPETIHIVTRADSDIQTVDDLSGQTINTGDLGSGTQVNAIQILEAVGVTDYNEQNTGFGQAAEQLQNGDIDASFVVGGPPVAAVEDLATTNDIHIVPIEGQARQQVMDAGSYYAEDEIAAEAYQGVDEAVPTVAVQAMIATREELSEDVVETITETIFRNLDGIDIKTDFISEDSAQEGMPIDLHPGAQAYFGGGDSESGSDNSSDTDSNDSSNRLVTGS